MQRSTKNHEYRTEERGSVFIELAIVLPLILLFIVGMLELGRVFRSLSWLNQTAFNVARAGAENPDSMALSAMQGRGFDHLSVLSVDLNSTTPVQVQRSPGIAPRTVRATVIGQMDSLLFGDALSLPISVPIVAPMLIEGSGSLAGINLSQFSDQ